ncbi:MAG: DUF2062 domain-containing protein [Nitrospirae bacterium]|nr:DUF2062 domain-containing protein [Nitrospirota bacterium]
MKIYSQIKEYIIRLVKKGLTPDEIAAGVAIGIFIGFIPLIGVHTLMAFTLAYFLRLNTFLVLLGTQISNPLSFPFQIFLSAEIGSLLLNGKLLDIKFSKDVSYLEHYILPIIVGSIVLGIIVSFFSYMSLKSFLKRRKS